MSETSERIAKILEDPESIRMITDLAESFMSGADPSKTSESAVESITDNQFESKNELSIIPKELTSVLSSIDGKISEEEIENTVRLIRAIQPYLSPKRHNGANNVIKILTALKSASSLNLSKIASIFGTQM